MFQSQRGGTKLFLFQRGGTKSCSFVKEEEQFFLCQKEGELTVVHLSRRGNLQLFLCRRGGDICSFVKEGELTDVPLSKGKALPKWDIRANNLLLQEHIFP